MTPFSRSLLALWQRNKHGYLSLVFPVRIAVSVGQITLFELNCDQNVNRGRNGKDQMTHSHFRCGPKSNDEPEQERVPHELVKKPFLEDQICVLLPFLKQIHLPDPKKIEVINHEGA